MDKEIIKEIFGILSSDSDYVAQDTPEIEVFKRLSEILPEESYMKQLIDSAIQDFENGNNDGLFYDLPEEEVLKGFRSIFNEEEIHYIINELANETNASELSMFMSEDYFQGKYGEQDLAKILDEFVLGEDIRTGPTFITFLSPQMQGQVLELRPHIIKDYMEKFEDLRYTNEYTYNIEMMTFFEKIDTQALGMALKNDSDLLYDFERIYVEKSNTERDYWSNGLSIDKFVQSLPEDVLQENLVGIMQYAYDNYDSNSYLSNPMEYVKHIWSNIPATVYDNLVQEHIDVFEWLESQLNLDEKDKNTFRESLIIASNDEIKNSIYKNEEAIDGIFAETIKTDVEEGNRYFSATVNEFKNLTEEKKIDYYESLLDQVFTSGADDATKHYVMGSLWEVLDKESQSKILTENPKYFEYLADKYNQDRDNTIVDMWGHTVEEAQRDYIAKNPNALQDLELKDELYYRLMTNTKNKVIEEYIGEDTQKILDFIDKTQLKSHNTYLTIWNSLSNESKIKLLENNPNFLKDFYEKITSIPESTLKKDDFSEYEFYYRMLSGAYYGSSGIVTDLCKKHPEMVKDFISGIEQSKNPGVITKFWGLLSFEYQHEVLQNNPDFLIEYTKRFGKDNISQFVYDMLNSTKRVDENHDNSSLMINYEILDRLLEIQKENLQYYGEWQIETFLSKLSVILPEEMGDLEKYEEEIFKYCIRSDGYGNQLFNDGIFKSLVSNGNAEKNFNYLEQKLQGNVDERTLREVQDIYDVLGTGLGFKYARKYFDVITKYGDENAIIKSSEKAKAMFGDDVQFDESGIPIVPDKVWDFISNVSDYSQIQDLEKFLPTIVRDWDRIQELVQYKIANSIIKDGLEVKLNLEEAINAAKQIKNRVEAKDYSSQELLMTPGSDQIGVDTQYTANPEKAMQRAFTVAKQMDDSGLTKKYPPASVDSPDGKLRMKLLHPQDKRRILLGYNTHCCFRPNGNADESGRSEYSLFSYANTTPYGGVLECFELDENGQEKDAVMGTPIMVSGNTVMFHSYETRVQQSPHQKQANELLTELAVQVLERSEGTLNAVLMTNLYTGTGRLDVSDKVSVGRGFFRPNFEGDLHPYSNMYNNLSGTDHMLLAARVGDKILTGQELKDYCDKISENGQYPERIVEALGLRLGPSEKDFAHSEEGHKCFELKTDQSGITGDYLSSYMDEYHKVKQEREFLALLNKRASLNTGKVLNEEELNLRNMLDKMIEQYPEEDVEKYYIPGSKAIDQDKVKAALDQNYDRLFELYSGKDLSLIAECYGLDLDTLTREYAERKAKETVISQESTKPKLTSKQRAIKGGLIGILSKADDKKYSEIIEHLKNDTFTLEDAKVLEEDGMLKKVGLDTAEKFDVTMHAKSTTSDEVKLESRRRSFIQEMLKRPSTAREALALAISPEPTEAEIQNETRKQAIAKIRSVVEEKVRSEIEDPGKYDYDIVGFRVNNTLSNMEGILIALDGGKELHDKDEIRIKKIEALYGINVREILEQERKAEAIERAREKIKVNKFAKVSSSVTVAIEAREHNREIVRGIRDDDREPELYDRMFVSKDWYIGVNSDGRAEVYARQEISDRSKAELDEKVQEMTQNPEFAANRDALTESYGKRFAPKYKAGQVPQVVGDVRMGETQEMMDFMKGELSKDDKTQNNDGQDFDD